MEEVDQTTMTPEEQAEYEANMARIRALDEEYESAKKIYQAQLDEWCANRYQQHQSRLAGVQWHLLQ